MAGPFMPPGSLGPLLRKIATKEESMRIEVYQDTPKEEEKVLRLRLIPTPDGVTLAAVNAGGIKCQMGNILTIRTDGIYRHYGLSPDLGLPIDHHRMVKDITP